MSTFGHESGAESADALLSSIEADVDKVDVVAEFAQDFLEKGLGGLALQSPEGVIHFKEMYSQMWDRVAGVLLAGDAPWRQQGVPRGQIESLLGSMWNLKDVQGHNNVAAVTFSLAYCEDRTDGVWGDIFGSTSYYGKNEVLRTVESICQEGNLGTFDSPSQTAAFLLDLVYVSYTLYLAKGEMIDKDELLSAAQSRL